MLRPKIVLRVSEATTIGITSAARRDSKAEIIPRCTRLRQSKLACRTFSEHHRPRGQTNFVQFRARGFVSPILPHTASQRVRRELFYHSEFRKTKQASRKKGTCEAVSTITEPSVPSLWSTHMTHKWLHAVLARQQLLPR